MKKILGAVLVVVLGIAGFFGYEYYRVQKILSGPAKEIVSESIEIKGDVWHVKMVSKLDTPVDDVYDAFSKPWRLHEFSPESYLKSELVSEEGNKKIVDFIARLEILPPGFKIQDPRIEFTYFPDEKRITTKTIDFKLADIDSEYTFQATPDGKGTIVTMVQTNKAKQAAIVEALQKGAIRESYVSQIRAATTAIAKVEAGEAER